MKHLRNFLNTFPGPLRTIRFELASKSNGVSLPVTKEFPELLVEHCLKNIFGAILCGFRRLIALNLQHNDLNITIFGKNCKAVNTDMLY